MLFTRCSGVLLHPTSFPGRYGIGDLGHHAFQFIDFLAHSQQRLWQVLPLGPTGLENSPYMCFSAMAGNPLLISPEQLYKDGFLEANDFDNLPTFTSDRIHFNQVTRVKYPLFHKAYERFQINATSNQRHAFEQFCHEKAEWLEDFALFMAIKRYKQGISWSSWEPELAEREATAIAACRETLSAQIQFEKFLQFEFFRQWSEVKKYANTYGVQIIGDIPIYVAHDSADVWANPKNFCLNPDTHQPALLAGTPPDFFSQTGQLWGNPVYDWNYLQQSDFQWWVQRFQAMLDYVDVIRIDHFPGFAHFWAIPENETDARKGKWISAPGEQFFQTLEQKLDTLPILAEDLGIITPDVEALRDKYQFPGMKILHFAFADPASPYLPFKYQPNCVVYTGTHDNDTTVGWFNSLGKEEQQNVLKYLGCTSSDGIHWDLIRLIFSSIANLAIVPLQDILGLDSDARMNTPGKQQGNWEWRYEENALTDEICDRLKDMTEFFYRAK
ncbi:MAG: 4-alpha-glucanotransferase [Oscillatoriales cyanobacterium C42_A2020_001]|nr:4-alpha-glucanotransferase [Leptolyngbyaceae cyanobacterium C42_A2020_001]